MPRRVNVEEELELARDAVTNDPDQLNTVVIKFKPAAYVRMLEACLNHKAETGNDLAISTFCYQRLMDSLDGGNMDLNPSEKAGMKTLQEIWKVSPDQAVKKLLAMLAHSDLADIIIESEIELKEARSKKIARLHSN